MEQSSGAPSPESDRPYSPLSPSAKRRVAQNVREHMAWEESVSIKIRTHFWLVWAEIAIEHEKAAAQARAAALEHHANRNYVGDATNQESHAALVAVTSAAFSLEAFANALGEKISRSMKREVETSESLRVRDTRGPARHTRILEILKVAFVIRGREGGGEWADELTWLFQARGHAVHYQESWGPTTPHPVGVNVAPDSVRYSLESARRAVNLILEIYGKCVAAPRESVRLWIEPFKESVSRLESLRQSQGVIPDTAPEN